MGKGHVVRTNNSQSDILLRVAITHFTLLGIDFSGDLDYIYMVELTYDKAIDRFIYNIKILYLDIIQYWGGGITDFTLIEIDFIGDLDHSWYN